MLCMLNEIGCSSPHITCLPFLVKSFIDFNNFCNSEQNILKKFTIPAKLLHPLTVTGGFNFLTASNLLHKGLMYSLLSLINIVFSIYCNSFLKT